MTAKIVPLPDIPGETSDTCKRAIDAVLAYSEESPIQSIAIVAVRADGSVVSKYYRGGNPFTLGGAVETLRRRIHDECIEKL